MFLRTLSCCLSICRSSVFVDQYPSLKVNPAERGRVVCCKCQLHVCKEGGRRGCVGIFFITGEGEHHLLRDPLAGGSARIPQEESGLVGGLAPVSFAEPEEELGNEVRIGVPGGDGAECYDGAPPRPPVQCGGGTRMRRTPSRTGGRMAVEMARVL